MTGPEDLAGAPPFWVARLHISQATWEKIANKHDLDAFDVRNAVQWIAGLRAVYDFNEFGKLRATTQISIGTRNVIVVLRPRASELGDEWNLASAY